MPELPEVETISRGLQHGGKGICPIVGKEIEDVRVLWERTLSNGTERSLRKEIIGQVIRSVSRRGKFVVVTLESDTLLFHLRMSGDLRVELSHDSLGKSIPVQKHDRLTIFFTDDYRLAFNDPRKFGRAWFTHNSQDILGKLGPEPLDPSLTAARLHQMLIRRKRQLKPLLMDQTFLAGLGNIYSDEALHLARLHPLQPSDRVTEVQTRQLLKAIRDVLKEGIKRNGASIDWVYRGGEFQNHFRVYQRDGQPCAICGTHIQRIMVGQRSTHFCPYCQRIN